MLLWLKIWMSLNIIIHYCGSVEIVVARKTTISPTISTEPPKTTISTPTTNSTSITATTPILKVTTSTPATTPVPPTKINSANTTGIMATNSTQSLNNTTILVKKIDRSKLNNYFCHCDLTLDVCDKNCCCDIDCTDVMKKSFICRPDQSMFISQGLPSCEDSASWFCVLEESPATAGRVFQGIESVESPKLYKWRKIFENEQNKNGDLEYHAGDSIWVLNENTEEFERLGIPISLNGRECQFQSEIQFLADKSTKCEIKIEKLNDLYNEALQHFQIVKVLKNPNYRSNKVNVMEHCVDEDCDCFEFIIYDCSPQMECEKIINQTDLVFNYDTVWNKIEMNLRHNFSNLLSGEIRLIKAPTYDVVRLDDEDIILEYIVKFLTINETNVHLSGNLGYNFEAPLISAKFLPVNETDPNNKEIYIDYFSTPMSKFVHLSLPLIRRRKCRPTHSSETIKFGENRNSKCEANLNEHGEFNLTSLSNYTTTCQRLQAIIYQHLFHESFNISNTWVSVFGNPKNNTDDWIRLDVVNYAEPLQIRGEYFDENIFTCHDMILNIGYEIYYGRYSLGKIKDQLLVTKAQLVFGEKLDVNFKLTEEISVPLYYDVIFFEISNSGSSEILSISFNYLLFMIIVISLCF